MAKMYFELTSPERLVLGTEVDELYAPADEGEIGILPDHISLVTSLATGELRYKNDGKLDYFAIEGGFLEVSNNKIVVLTEHADLGKDIDVEDEKKRKLIAEETLELAYAEASKNETTLDTTGMEETIKRSDVRLSVASHYSAQKSNEH
ncbi:hypothetical protein RsTz2092_05470 [Deferribacterales bacterium RsTz2092]|nr:hypothetical protein AGMMS49941_00600 [Deferribacterales bacterium]